VKQRDKKKKKFIGKRQERLRFKTSIHFKKKQLILNMSNGQYQNYPEKRRFFYKLFLMF